MSNLARILCLKDGQKNVMDSGVFGIKLSKMGFYMWIMPGFGSNYTSCKIKQNKKGWKWFELKESLALDMGESLFLLVGYNIRSM